MNLRVTALLIVCIIILVLMFAFIGNRMNEKVNGTVESLITKLSVREPRYDKRSLPRARSGAIIPTDRRYYADPYNPYLSSTKYLSDYSDEYKYQWIDPELYKTTHPEIDLEPDCSPNPPQNYINLNAEIIEYEDEMLRDKNTLRHNVQDRMYGMTSSVCNIYPYGPMTLADAAAYHQMDFENKIGCATPGCSCGNDSLADYQACQRERMGYPGHCDGCNTKTACGECEGFTGEGMCGEGMCSDKSRCLCHYNEACGKKESCCGDYSFQGCGDKSSCCPGNIGMKVWKDIPENGLGSVSANYGNGEMYSNAEGYCGSSGESDFDLDQKLYASTGVTLCAFCGQNGCDACNKFTTSSQYKYLDDCDAALGVQYACNHLTPTMEQLLECNKDFSALSSGCPSGNAGYCGSHCGCGGACKGMCRNCGCECDGCHCKFKSKGCRCTCGCGGFCGKDCPCGCQCGGICGGFKGSMCPRCLNKLTKLGYCDRCNIARDKMIVPGGAEGMCGDYYDYESDPAYYPGYSFYTYYGLKPEYDEPSGVFPYCLDPYNQKLPFHDYVLNNDPAGVSVWGKFRSKGEGVYADWSEGRPLDPMLQIQAHKGY